MKHTRSSSPLYFKTTQSRKSAELLEDYVEAIDEILNKLESKDVDLASSIEDYQRLIYLNKQVNQLFKKKVKSISTKNQKLKKNDKKKTY